MKSVQNIIAAAVVLATLPFANAGVAKAVTTTVSAIGSSAPTTIAVSGSSAPTTVAVSGSSAPTTVAVSGSIGGTTVTPSASFGAPPTASTSFSSVSASTGFPAQSGGFVVTGIYTTCLTVTFDAAPTASASTGLPIESFSNAFPTTTAFAVSASASSFSEAAPSFSASAEPVTSTVIASSSVPENVAVFTTCLAFLPGASSASATSTAVASFSSASASTVAFSTAPASVLTTRVASSRAAGATTTRVASSRAAATPTVA